MIKLSLSKQLANTFRRALPQVKPIAPLAEPLLDLLRPSEYRGPSAEPSTQPSSTSAQQSSQPVDDVQLFSFEALLAQVQCSRGELAELLHRIGAFCLDGKTGAAITVCQSTSGVLMQARSGLLLTDTGFKQWTLSLWLALSMHCPCRSCPR